MAGDGRMRAVKLQHPTIYPEGDWRNIAAEDEEGRIVEGSKKRNRKIYLSLTKANKEWNCQICGHNNNKNDLVVHHINQDNEDNRLDNLKVLCQSCHSRLHYELKRGDKYGYSKTVKQ